MMAAEVESAALWAVLTEGQGTYSDTEEPEFEEVEVFSHMVA